MTFVDLRCHRAHYVNVMYIGHQSANYLVHFSSTLLIWPGNRSRWSSRADKLLWLFTTQIPGWFSYRWLNSSPPSAAYMYQWIGSVLVQIMACRLFGTLPWSKQMLGYYQLDPWEQKFVNVNQNTKLFIHKNATENIVSEMAAILSRKRWVNANET